MQTRKTYARFALVCAVFGTTFLAIRMCLLGGATPFLASGLRFTFAGAVLVSALALNKKIRAGFLRKKWRQIAILGLFQTSITFGTMYFAETRLDSGYMARLDALGPLFTAAFALAIMRKRLHAAHWIGFALGTAGTFLLAGKPGSPDFDAGFLAIALVGTAAYSLSMVLYDRFFGKDDDPVAINALQMLVGGLVLLAAVPIFEKPAFPLNASTVGALLYLAVVGSIVAHTVNCVVIRDAGPVFASAWLYVSPVLASFAGFIALGERVTPLGAVGTALALLGVLAVNRAEKSSPNEKKHIRSTEAERGLERNAARSEASLARADSPPRELSEIARP